MRCFSVFLRFFTAVALIACSGTAVAGSASHGAVNAHRRHGAALLPERHEPGRNETHLAKRFDNARYSYYYVSQGPVACNSNRYKDSDFIVALNVPQWDGGSHCGETITLSWGGKTTTAVIVDQCTGCPYGGIDLTPGLFTFFAGSLDAGYIWGTWNFGDEQPKPKPSSTSSIAKSTQSSSHSSSHSQSSSSSSASSSMTSASASATPSATPTPTSVTTQNETAPATSASDVTSPAESTPTPSAAPAGTINQWMQAYVQLAGMIAAVEAAS